MAKTLQSDQELLESGYTVGPRAIDKIPADQGALYRYLYTKAVYKPRIDKRTGVKLEAGQVLLTFSFIVEHFKPMRWDKCRVISLAEKLKERRLISIKRAKYKRKGVLFTISDYNTLQDVRNYGSAKDQPINSQKPSADQPNINTEIHKPLLDTIAEPTKGKPELEYIDNAEGKVLTLKTMIEFLKWLKSQNPFFFNGEWETKESVQAAKWVKQGVTQDQIVEAFDLMKARLTDVRHAQHGSIVSITYLGQIVNEIKQGKRLK